LSIIDDNFIKFIDVNNYNKNIGYHVHNEYKSIGFVHHNLNDPVIYSNIVKRIERLKMYNIDTSQKKLYVTALKYESENPDYNYMYVYHYNKELQKKIANMNHIIILLSKNRKEKKNIVNIIINTDNLAVIHLYTNEEILSSNFVNENDNKAYEAIIKKIKVSGKNFVSDEKNRPETYNAENETGMLKRILPRNTFVNLSQTYTYETVNYPQTYTYETVNYPQTYTYETVNYPQNGGATNDNYYQKYLKYKNKYFEMKKNKF
jgi:hypothetical protein